MTLATKAPSNATGMAVRLLVAPIVDECDIAREPFETGQLSWRTSRT
jgi:hypothetical protein